MTSRRTALTTLAACLWAGPDLGPGRFPDIPENSWPGVLALANEHLVSIVLQRAVARYHDAVPADVGHYLAHLHVLNCRRNRRIRRQARELVGALNDAGIVPMVLKGALMTLCERTIGVGSRIMADIDLAVPAETRAAALAVLRRLGYAANHAFPAGHHAVGEFVRDGDPAAVDLHVELIDQSYVLPAAEVWAGASPASCAGGGRYLVPSPTHRVLHNILHAQIHYRGGFYLAELDLRQLFELAWLTRAYAGAIDWQHIAERLARYHLTVPLHSYLRNAGILMGLAWPLAEPCLMRAKLHAGRCRLQHAYPRTRAATAAWANLRAAFAWHRMEALYASSGGRSVPSAAWWRARHLRTVLGHHSPSFIAARLFRG